MVELWCGVGSIAAAASGAGYVVRQFDKFRVPGITDGVGSSSEDLLSASGFMSAVHCVLSMRERGLLWMGPVCSSFVFMNSSKCKRSLANPLGDVNYKRVVEGNLHASVAAFLFALASLRGVLPIIENPAGSMIFRFPLLASVLTFFSAGKAICCRCAFAAERMGKRWRKAYKLVGHAWVTHLSAPCKCRSGMHCSLVHRIMKNNSVKTTGCKDLLRASAAYPPRMGKFVIRMWKMHGCLFSTSARATRPVHRPPVHRRRQRVITSTQTPPVGWKTPSHDDTPGGHEVLPAVSFAWKSPSVGASSSVAEEGDRHASWKMPRCNDAVATGESSDAWKVCS